jgi:hypothetical protein
MNTLNLVSKKSGAKQEVLIRLYRCRLPATWKQDLCEAIDKKKAQSFADRQKRSPAVKSARVRQLS